MSPIAKIAKCLFDTTEKRHYINRRNVSVCPYDIIVPKAEGQSPINVNLNKHKKAVGSFITQPKFNFDGEVLTVVLTTPTCFGSTRKTRNNTRQVSFQSGNVSCTSHARDPTDFIFCQTEQSQAVEQAYPHIQDAYKIFFASLLELTTFSDYTKIVKVSDRSRFEKVQHRKNPKIVKQRPVQITATAKYYGLETAFNRLNEWLTENQDPAYQGIRDGLEKITMIQDTAEKRAEFINFLYKLTVSDFDGYESTITINNPTMKQMAELVKHFNISSFWTKGDIGRCAIKITSVTDYMKQFVNCFAPDTRVETNTHRDSAAQPAVEYCDMLTVMKENGMTEAIVDHVFQLRNRKDPNKKHQCCITNFIAYFMYLMDRKSVFASTKANFSGRQKSQWTNNRRHYVKCPDNIDLTLEDALDDIIDDQLDALDELTYKRSCSDNDQSIAYKKRKIGDDEESTTNDDKESTTNDDKESTTSDFVGYSDDICFDLMEYPKTPEASGIDGLLTAAKHVDTDFQDIFGETKQIEHDTTLDIDDLLTN